MLGIPECLRQLVTAPKQSNIILWRNDNGEFRATVFKCPEEKLFDDISKLLLPIFSFLGIARLDTALFEEEFPSCYMCNQFIQPMQQAGITSLSQIEDILSKDIVSGAKTSSAGHFSPN